jgi:hypothetical protein
MTAKASIYAIKRLIKGAPKEVRKFLHKQKMAMKKAENQRPARSQKLHRVTANLSRKHPKHGQHPHTAYKS